VVPELASEFPAGPEQVGRAALADLDSEALDSADLVPVDRERVGPASAVLEQVDLEQVARERATSDQGNRAARVKVVREAQVAPEQ